MQIYFLSHFGVKKGIIASLHIYGVLFVEGFKHHLLSISQLCEKEHKVVLNQIFMI